LDGEELYFRFQRLRRPGVVGIDDNEPVTDFHDLDQAASAPAVPVPPKAKKPTWSNTLEVFDHAGLLV
jgi:hypothetical protein